MFELNKIDVDIIVEENYCHHEDSQWLQCPVLLHVYDSSFLHNNLQVM